MANDDENEGEPAIKISRDRREEKNERFGPFDTSSEVALADH